MRIKLLLCTLAASALASASAQATMVAGWDFSQYLGDSSLIIDGTFANTDSLDANYSDLDPTFNAGAESAAFGTLYFDGQFGSTNVDENAFPPAFTPTAAVGGSLASNLFAPVVNPFDSLTILASEGQPFQSLLAMTASSTLSVVFEADLTSIPEFGQDWEVSFGGRTFSGTSTVGIEFSTDGVSYTPFGSVNLTTTDTPYTVALGTGSSDNAYVRFNFDPQGVDQPIIDNVAFGANVVVPEPGTALLLFAGLLGLRSFGSRVRG